MPSLPENWATSGRTARVSSPTPVAAAVMAAAGVATVAETVVTVTVGTVAAVDIVNHAAGEGAGAPAVPDRVFTSERRDPAALVT